MTRSWRTWWWALGAIVILAAVLRLWNLGTFSLWIDEVFTVTAADQPLAGTLAACAEDAENVPVYAVIANLGLALGADETMLRLAPIAAGLASIVLLAVWTRRHLGMEVALLAAAFAALSSFHLRYSQELRAYPYLLVIGTLTLLAADRLRMRPDWRSTLGLAAAVAVGCYTHLTYLMVLVPAAGSLLLPTGDRDGSTTIRWSRPVWTRYVIAVGLGLAAFAPWVWLISRTLVERMPRPWITEWSVARVADRWHVLTVGAWAHESVGWTAFILAAVAVSGFLLVLRRPIGKLVFLPAVLTLVAWEVFLLVIHHWSSSRYATVLWPLLAVLVACGFHQVLVTLRWRWLRLAASASMAALMLTHVSDYYEIGRPHWDRVAHIVEETRRPGEPVVASNHWTRKCLSHYLGEAVPTVHNRSERLAPFLESSSTILLVRRMRSPAPDLDGVTSSATRLASIPQTAWIYRIEAPAGTVGGEPGPETP